MRKNALMYRSNKVQQKNIPTELSFGLRAGRKSQRCEGLQRSKASKILRVKVYLDEPISCLSSLRLNVFQAL